MKLSSTQNSTSFYESFSDLIFATMAIFVLLMIIFMALIQANGMEDVEALQQELAKRAEKLAEAEAERDRSREQMAEMVEELTKSQSSVTATGLELVVAVDVSGSMEEPLGHLVEALQTIATVVPRIAKVFRIGVVAYRNAQGSSQLYEIFPLKEILPSERDGGRSFDQISGFLNSLRAENGLAPISEAVDESIGMLQSSRGFDGFQTFLLLGDAGPYELSWDDGIFTPDKRRFEPPVIRRIADWVDGAERRSVISLFSGDPEHSRHEPPIRRQLEESLRFFRDIAVEADQDENFTRNPANMLAYLLNSVVERE